MNKKNDSRTDTAVWYFVAATFALVSPTLFSWEAMPGGWMLWAVGLGLLVLGFIVWRGERRQRRATTT